MKVNEAREYLGQLKKLDKLIENKLAERQHWRNIALSISPNMSGDRVQSSGSQQKMADAIHRYVDMEREIDACVDRLVDKRREIIETIEQLPAIEYDVLHKMYVQYMDYYAVSDAYGKSYSWATSVHGRALQHLQEILSKR